MISAVPTAPDLCCSWLYATAFVPWRILALSCDGCVSQSVAAEYDSLRVHCTPHVRTRRGADVRCVSRRMSACPVALSRAARRRADRPAGVTVSPHKSSVAGGILSEGAAALPRRGPGSAFKLACDSRRAELKGCLKGHESRWFLWQLKRLWSFSEGNDYWLARMPTTLGGASV